MTTPVQIPAPRDSAADVLEQVRTTPVPPLGVREPTGLQLADLASQLTALGFEQAQVSAFLQLLQTIIWRTTVEACGPLLAQIQKLEAAKINTILQLVRGLPEAVPPQGALARLMSAGQPVASIVHRDAVLSIIAAQGARSHPIG